MEIVISFILILLILLSVLITFKRKIKTFASDVYELNYDSVTFDDLLDEIKQIKKQKISDLESPLYRFFNHPIVQALAKPFVILLWLIVIVLIILIAMFMATMLLIFW